VPTHSDTALSKWLLRLSFSSFDVPNYLETDYMSLSVFLVYYPVSAEHLNPLLASRFPAYAVRMYNWKYLN
jgi:hypothetical protein